MRRTNWKYLHAYVYEKSTEFASNVSVTFPENYAGLDTENYENK